MPVYGFIVKYMYLKNICILNLVIDFVVILFFVQFSISKSAFIFFFVDGNTERVEPFNMDVHGTFIKSF